MSDTTSSATQPRGRHNFESCTISRVTYLLERHRSENVTTSRATQLRERQNFDSDHALRAAFVNYAFAHSLKRHSSQLRLKLPSVKRRAQKRTTSTLECKAEVQKKYIARRETRASCAMPTPPDTCNLCNRPASALHALLKFLHHPFGDVA